MSCSAPFYLMISSEDFWSFIWNLNPLIVGNTEHYILPPPPVLPHLHWDCVSHYKRNGHWKYPNLLTTIMTALEFTLECWLSALVILTTPSCSDGQETTVFHRTVWRKRLIHNRNWNHCQNSGPSLKSRNPRCKLGSVRIFYSCHFGAVLISCKIQSYWSHVISSE